MLYTITSLECFKSGNNDLQNPFDQWYTKISIIFIRIPFD